MVVLGLALGLPPDPGELYVGDWEPGHGLHAGRDHGGEDGAHQRRHEGRHHHHRGRHRAREEVQRPGEVEECHIVIILSLMSYLSVSPASVAWGSSEY